MMHSPAVTVSDDNVMAVISQPSEKRWLKFTSPVEICQTTHLDEIEGIIKWIEQKCKQSNLHAVGFISYEAAPAFDIGLASKPSEHFPLIWFALFDGFEVVDMTQLQSSHFDEKIKWQANIDEQQYRNNIKNIKHYIREGDTYQVNYSFRLNSPIDSSPWQLFTRMIEAQDLIHHDGYCAFIETENWAICSASPELFIHYEARDKTLTSLPMKGTAPRGTHFAQDTQQAMDLQQSVKNRAENIMITDMVRNDCGKIADIGSVKVNDLLKLNQYPTFWTLTSKVQAKCEYDLFAILQALFPAASITGAPKARAMQIIDELEDTPRHIYTGSIGMINAEQIQLNVAIRTVLIDKQKHTANFGVGGGIVWDSQSEDEFAECATKANVLTYRAPSFALLTTMLWHDGQYHYLDQHLNRLKNSAAYFNWHIDLQAIENALQKKAKEFSLQAKRVRLQLARTQQIHIEAHDLKPLVMPYTLSIANNHVNSSDYFLHHKTTNRTAYDNAQSNIPSDDIVLINERNHITETKIANIIIRHQNQWLTPDLNSGLLNGIGRQLWLKQHPDTIEKPISVDMLKQAEAIYLTNAVRGAWQAQLLKH